MTTKDAFAGLEPSGVWRHFAELTRIARPSKDEGADREQQGGAALRPGGVGHLEGRRRADGSFEYDGVQVVTLAKSSNVARS